jgi:gamma-glutamylcyclotransferase (GGCT)/AIG2-like uncharacterized protein YtfP
MMNGSVSPPPANPEPLPIFVYGTLKRGGCRARFWPYPPLSIEPATVRGTLYDLGPYPALVPGEGWVRGELWRLRAEHVAPTLAALDAVEGYSVSPGDLYLRVVVECRTADGGTCRAYAYQYAQPQRVPPDRAVPPDASGCCEWREAVGTSTAPTKGDEGS